MCQNPYLNSWEKRALDISIAGLALPPYIACLGAAALHQHENPLMSFERTTANGDSLEINKIKLDRSKRVGRILFELGFDEMPQIVESVLRGDMSIVGPRATSPRRHEQIVNTLPPSLRMAREIHLSNTRPGIISTYSLLSHRGLSTKEQARLRTICDIRDAQHGSILFDLRLCAKVIRKKEAFARIREELMEHAESATAPECQRCVV